VNKQLLLLIDVLQIIMLILDCEAENVVVD
jgi:hypothetical protein